ncbi:SAM-dependent methyltransferase PhcB [Actinoplanes sp. SE50]|uniref:class I SAM-dependent methyltransferase n=1 Tax=unclassified Actinoplanes TaxID=2626549 RepID=UPI00023EBF4E|nr:MULTISPECIES: methyltransferase domain-containing protein [unclassified Actinoplanes]AEV85739.1 ubiquinone/menaquinone biosynthesis methyltransferase [Actinoplanes sp. SE50/110]ATO84132.1 SAM-dependent methyltransferase PhcB [Actinoplanes sp. SE50]SLM01542.1 SAM-dependent methyltransferase [Actinoplanes sp. SE50/110]
MDFAGSVPANYDRYLGPLLFQPFARDLASRLADRSPSRVLELAAGTGIVTAEVARALPDAVIVATDLSQAMLDVAAARRETAGVRFEAVDAQNLPFGDDSFDAVCCQFGVMFLPDKARAYAEMRRVLRPGGGLLFNVWERIEDSPIAATVEAALQNCFPDDPPQFLSRVPHGYHDATAIRDAVRAAAFGEVDVVTVSLPSVSPSAGDAAIGFCQGTPIRHEIVSRGGDLAAVTESVRAALTDKFGTGEVRADMAALVVTAC